jgi:hypothetical protein
MVTIGILNGATVPTVMALKGMVEIVMNQMLMV